MADDIEVCTAAFFKSKGKGVVTENEFLMDVSMTRRWMPYGDAERLLAAMLASGTVRIEDGYVRPSIDVRRIDVPVGFRPSADMAAGVPAPVQEEDAFRVLMDMAAGMDMDRKEFLGMCRTLQKRMNIEIEAAAAIVLRDRGADVSGVAERVCSAISAR